MFLWICLVWVFYITTIWYVDFLVWLLSFNKAFEVDLTCSMHHSLLCLNSISSYVCITICLSTHWLKKFRLFPSHLTIINAVFINPIVCKFSVWTYASISLGYILSGGIDGSYGDSIINFVRNWWTVFYSGCTLSIPISSVWGFLFLYILAKACYFRFFKIIAILMGMMWYLTEVLICNFLWNNVVYQWCWVSFHAFDGYLYIFFGEGSIQFLCPFKKLGCLSFCWWVVRLIYIFWILNSSGFIICKIILPFCEFFQCLGYVPWIIKVLHFDDFQFVWFFFFFACAFGGISKKSLLNPRPQRSMPILSSKTFIALAITFRSLTHFELILIYDLI